MSAFPALTALAVAALVAPALAAPVAAQSPSGGASADYDVSTGGVDGGPDEGAEEAGVAIASRPPARSVALARRVSTLLGEPVRPLPLALGDGVVAFLPASAAPIAVFHPARRPLGAPVLALACAVGGCAVSVGPSLLIDGWGPTSELDLARQGAAVAAGRTFVVRLRLTRAQRQAVASSSRPRLRLRISVVDSAGHRHAATRTTPVAAPMQR